MSWMNPGLGFGPATWPLGSVGPHRDWPDLSVPIVTNGEIQTLGTYNQERSRGILHSEEWKVKMADLQKRYDRAMDAMRPAGSIQYNPNEDREDTRRLDEGEM